MTTEVARILRAAADLIEPPGRWTQHHRAVTASGRPVMAKDVRAVAWCVRGALERCVDDWRPYQDANERLAEHVGVSTTLLTLRWNDAAERTPAEVVAALRAAADEAERSS